jgi:hypothetical protein
MASQSFREGQAAFARHNFAAAAAAFEQAARFELHPSPLLNAEEAWEKAGELVHAAQDCDAVLALPDAQPRYRSEATHRLDALAPKIATLELRGPRTVTVRVDSSSEIRLPARHRLSPGSHTLSVTDLNSSGTQTRTVDLRPGESQILDFTPPAPAPETLNPPAPAPAKPTPANGGPPAATWLSFGVAAASAGVAVVFGLLTNTAQSDFNADPTESNASTFRRDKLVTNVAWGIAAAGAIAGVVFWLTAPRSRAETGVAFARIRF